MTYDPHKSAALVAQAREDDNGFNGVFTLLSAKPTPVKRARLDSEGVIYALLLSPLMPTRIKVGFTSSSLSTRLGQHRVTCPELEVLGTWRGRRSDEHRAHGSLSGRLGANEIFDVPDVAAALAALDGALGVRLA